MCGNYYTIKKKKSAIRDDNIVNSFSTRAQRFSKFYLIFKFSTSKMKIKDNIPRECLLLGSFIVIT